MIVDFHSHTCESDGTLSPRGLSEFMHRRGVQIFSITDHDTLAAYEGLAAPAGTRIVTGIEINTAYADSEVHILGYALPTSNGRLQDVLERNRAARRKRVGRIVEQLREAGHDIAMEHVEAEATPRAALGRPHVGKALIRRGIAPDIETAFRKFLRRGTPGYVPSTHMGPHEAIEVVTAAGGVPVLAHPGRLKDYDVIDELVGHGLRGLEVFYPSHERLQVHHFRERAKRLGLVMTAGSDFHDIRYHTRGVGIEVDDEDIRPFLELTGAA
ncbi:MAG TPA: PHP domain-containing protein [Candidatus Baltobacteraceae bacterium]|nr:PHP domain-containing protein [Candidatus Baltobacteraceae bacterium]